MTRTLLLFLALCPAAAKEIALAIRSTYYPLFRSLEQCLAAYEKDPAQ